MEVRIRPQKLLETVFLWLKLPVLIFEHTDCSARVDDQHLPHLLGT